MWIMTTTGFFSIVSAGGRNVQVRARARADLVRLKRKFQAKEEILSTPQADYPFRMIVPTKTWTRWAKGLAVGAADYKNFKNEIKRRDADRAKIYSRVWSVCRDIQLPPAGDDLQREFDRLLSEMLIRM